jgi:hypothetical protein
MALGIGGIVSIGGGSSGGGSGGSTSGILDINGQLGPSILISAVNGISISTAANVITVDASSLSGIIPSGINRPPPVVSYSASFSNISSGFFSHNFNTKDVVVQVYEGQIANPNNQILPDEVILENYDSISVIFNSPQTGRVVVQGPYNK